MDQATEQVLERLAGLNAAFTADDKGVLIRYLSIEADPVLEGRVLARLTWEVPDAFGDDIDYLDGLCDDARDLLYDVATTECYFRTASELRDEDHTLGLALVA